MDELQVKTIEKEPAMVIFNHEEIEKDLEENLQKYSGLTFTEDTAAECKKVVAELRKGKKAVDDYRKQTKKELTAPVTEFENKCKSLNKKFDEVINPLVEQHEAFEQKRKEEKSAKVKEVMDIVIGQKNLSDKYASQLTIDDGYLAKSKSLKSIEEDLRERGDHLKLMQEKEESDKQTIQSAVQYVNSNYGVSLSEAPYMNLVDYQDVKDIKAQIMDDGQAEADKRLHAEQCKKEREAKQVEYEHEIAQSDVEPEPEIPFNDFPDEFEDPFAMDDTRQYVVTGTDEQLEELESYMNEAGLSWRFANYE